MRVLAVLMFALAGCSGGDDLSDLEEFMAGVRSRQNASVGPQPTFDEPAPFAYRAGDRRSPFAPWIPLGKVATRPENVAIAPDFSRPRQHLEYHPIEEISLVGSLSRKEDRYGLVRDGHGAVHRVGVGDYVGEDYGRIRKVGPGAVEFVEIVSDGAGGWVERVRVVTREASRWSREAD